MLIILPSILFVAGRELEKLLLAKYERMRIQNSWPSGDWFALLMECLILLAVLSVCAGHGLRNRNMPVRLAVYDLLIGTVLGALVTAANRLLGLPGTIVFSIPEMLVLCAVGPVSEELVYRGFVLERSRRIFSVRGSLVISSLLFAAAHGNIRQIPEAFLAGLVFGVIAYRTKDLKNSCLAHAVTNAVIYCLSLT